MFGFLKQDPIKKLEKKYQQISEEAMKAQRNGNIELYSELTFQAESLLKEIDELEKTKDN
jgi:molybdenum-dependent DNA-binding transcriptional regulator ModE